MKIKKIKKLIHSLLEQRTAQHTIIIIFFLTKCDIQRRNHYNFNKHLKLTL